MGDVAFGDALALAVEHEQQDCAVRAAMATTLSAVAVPCAPGRHPPCDTVALTTSLLVGGSSARRAVIMSVADRGDAPAAAAVRGSLPCRTRWRSIRPADKAMGRDRRR
jgi:hypothetical protein